MADEAQPTDQEPHVAGSAVQPPVAGAEAQPVAGAAGVGERGGTSPAPTAGNDVEASLPASPGPGETTTSPGSSATHSASGAFTPYVIGDAGRAFSRTVPSPSNHIGVPDTVLDGVTVADPQGTPQLVIRAASGRGLAHQQYGDPRQDAYAFDLSEDGRHLVAVVSDGVSAAPWSHLGARIATEEGCAHVAKQLVAMEAVDIPWRDLFVMLSERMRDACATLPSSEACDVELDDHEVAQKMAATIIVGVVGLTPDQDGSFPVTVVRLGDASGWLLDRVDGWIPLGEVKNEGNVIAESATACLPLVPESDPVIVETSLDTGAALFLLTDGVGDPLGSGRGEVGAALQALWTSPPHPIQFAAQVCFGRKTFDDDRAAIGIWPAADG